ncbi:AraC family transcriptional regulator [Acutalibacter muris]|uniref:AraC family transcriptional regulator n=1 Tax=Acutalibacter muris TaxID=1796620 RepID=UPI00272E6B83|nr:AraC family transcriptional regulator [Acutalibacter muris]
MELTSQKREVKLHGTYGFPVYVGRKLISAYPTGSFPWHWHDEVEFTLAAAGRMEYRVNDSRYLLSAGEGLFCNSGALHSGSMRETDCDYISITVHPRLLSGFEGSLVGAKYVAPLVERQGLSSILLTRREPWQAIVLEYLHKIYELCSHRPEGYELLVQTHFMQIWVELSAHCAAQAGGGQSEDPEKLRRLREILTFLHEHYADKITLEDIAAHVGLCKSECCRFFKRQMGTPLFDYLLDYRVGKSLINLKEGSSVSEAAEAAGFNDPSYYAKVFRAHTGRSPSQYRKEIGDRSA